MRRAVALALAVGVAVAGCRRGDGPVPIAYDRTPCAHCRMVISDPSFAAQLQTVAGDVLDFDDPGCLLSHRADRAPDVRALYFHHVREDRWIPGEAVAFAHADHTPMGFGLGAVDAGEAGALTLEEAEARVRSGPEWRRSP